MLACEGQLKDLYTRLDLEYDKAHGHSEEDSSDEWSKVNIDTGSDDGGRSNGGESSESVSKAKKWALSHQRWEPAELSQAFVAPVSVETTELDDIQTTKAEGDEAIGVGKGKGSGNGAQSPEATTP